eukprot:4699172-Alexandrium_andersonii.AAC.1
MRSPSGGHGPGTNACGPLERICGLRVSLLSAGTQPSTPGGDEDARAAQADHRGVLGPPPVRVAGAWGSVG